ncbi:MAG: hypothetical protein HYX68_03715 [Planctomycetes bacterium]|nr:hypothetical protein [Planctomycetota bacterium]
MTTCDFCRDRLLDFAYGLLEEGEHQELTEHLNFCADCQAGLERVRAEQRMLAQATHAIAEVPEFTLPASEPAPVPTPNPATMPMSAPPPTARAVWRRAWVAWSAAAAVLILVMGSLSYYRHTVHGLQTELAARRDEYKQAAAQFAALPVKYAKLHQHAIADFSKQKPPYVHVTGPTTLTLGAKAKLHLTARHIETDAKGPDTRIGLRIDLFDEPGQKVMPTLKATCDNQGHATVELDARNLKPDTRLNLVVEADSIRGKTKIEQPLRTTSRTFVTRIDTNKIVYQHRDVLFFRVLILDRFSMQPPVDPIPLRIELVNTAGRPVRSLNLSTAAGGVLANEFAIDDQMEPGAYTLMVRPADAARKDIQPVSQRLDLVRELALPDLVLDRLHYRPGEKVGGVYLGHGMLAKEAMIGAQSVPLMTQPQPGAIPAPPAGFGGKGAAPMVRVVPGVAQRFWAAIPRNLPAGANRVAITFKIGEGKQAREIRRHIHLAATDFALDLFPEGGDLVAGVPNRVFYRVRTQNGEPIQGDGTVSLLAGKTEPIISSHRLGMGYFDFVPAAKESYSVRINTAGRTQTVLNPFAQPGIRATGVVLHVPNAVVKPGEPITVTLRQRGPKARLLILAKCRGQIVDQSWVEARPGGNQVTLHPPADTVGMIRVTAYELLDNVAPGDLAAAIVGVATPGEALTGKSLTPVAERLVFRQPSQKLELGLMLSPRPVSPGGKLTGAISARDEKGDPASAWLLASVIDERFQARPQSLSAYFLLSNEIHSGADLDDAQVILRDGPESTAILERFLGTHGWRRFARSQEPSLGVLTNAARRPAQLLIFSRESQPLEGLRQRHENQLADALMPIHVAGFRDEDHLKSRVASLMVAVNVAAENLHRFEERVQLGIRLSLGIFVLVMLLITLVLMAVGVYRILRGHRVATPCFGSAFACLTLCLIVYFSSGFLGGLQVFLPATTDRVEQASFEIRRQLGEQFAQLPKHDNGGERSPTGDFFVRIPSLDAKPTTAQSARAQKSDPIDAGRADPVQRLQQRLADTLSRRGNGMHLAKADRKSNDKAGGGGPGAMSKRFVKSQHVGKAGNAGGVAQPMAVDQAKSKKAVAVAPAMAPPGPMREFAYQFTPFLPADTLLWHPNHRVTNGQATVRFDVPANPTNYRVLLLVHDSAGRFGYLETHVTIPAQ